MRIKTQSINLPDVGDLASRLRFTPGTGHIHLDERRMILMHTRAMGVLRREIVEQVGLNQARAILTRTGYEAGSMDADLSNKVRSKEQLMDAFSVGPQLHALEGVVLVEPVSCEIDPEKGQFYAEYLWHHSYEDSIHIEEYGIGAEPVCWSQIGYASGYASTFLGRPIIYREVECRATGQSHCRIIGKPAEQWDNPEEDLQYMRAETSGSHKNKNVRAYVQGINLQSPTLDSDTSETVVGASAGFNAAYHKMKRVAETDATVLFLGESGVGKGLFAKTLHRMSHLSDQPLISVNCAAIPENLIEAELFGVEKGAYTGATESRAGRFERADGGTLFLDEIGTLSLAAQGKILRAIQDNEIERVGDYQVRKVQVRIIAATNVDLRQAVAEKTFREDLFYRLNVFPIKIPPLRDRKADLPLLLDRMLTLYCKRHGKHIPGFTDRAIAAVLSYDWPGNIREMENLIERGVILAENDNPIDFAHIFNSGEDIDIASLTLDREGYLQGGAVLDKVLQKNTSAVIESLIDTNVSLKEAESYMIHQALSLSGGNKSKAARRLGLTRSQLLYRLSK